MFEAGSYEEIPLDGMRKTIAKRLVESKQTVPHFYLALDCELDALMALREQINAGAPKDKDGKPAFKLSVNDFVIKALALALQRVPAANSVWADDRILRLKHSDVGVAVAIEGGLFTPVIRKAESKTLTTISAEMKDFAGPRAQPPPEAGGVQGGSTAVSNLGMFGIKDFLAVINPPQGTILAVGAGEKRVVVKNDAPAIVQAMTVTLSCDHRVGGRCTRGRTAGGVQGADREPDGDAGLADPARPGRPGRHDFQARSGPKTRMPGSSRGIREQWQINTTSSSSAADRAATSRRSARRNSGSRPRSSSASISAASASTGAAFPPRRCCVRPRSTTT